MVESTKYDLRISSHGAQSLLGEHFIEYHFRLMVDAAIWREGVASSPEGLGRAIGDAIRDLAERLEHK